MRIKKVFSKNKFIDNMYNLMILAFMRYLVNVSIKGFLKGLRDFFKQLKYY